MIAGVVTPAIIMSGSGNTGLNLSPADRTQMVSTSLITSGLLSLIQITRFRVANTPYFLGTGLLSVVGTSFIYLPVLQSSVSNMYASGVCKSSVDPTTGAQTFEPCPDAWGAYLGTCMVCALLPIILSFVPPRALKRVFPPIVTGVTVMLIGVNLVTSGMQQWGGGSGPCLSRPTTGPFVDCPSVGAPNAAPWGSAQWIGLGFLVFSIIMVVEFFGSPFMKNAQVVIGLIVGMIVAIACGYTTSESLDAAPVITFLWVKTYKLSIYPPAIIPLLITYVLVGLSLSSPFFSVVRGPMQMQRQPTDPNQLITSHQCRQWSSRSGISPHHARSPNCPSKAENSNHVSKEEFLPTASQASSPRS